MGVQTISTNIYTCDFCGATSETPDRWFQIWVINVMDPKFFDTARCAIALLTEANVAPDISVVVNDVTPEPATPDTPQPEPVTPDTPTPQPEPTPEPTPDPAPVDEEPPLDPEEPQPAP